MINYYTNNMCIIQSPFTRLTLDANSLSASATGRNVMPPECAILSFGPNFYHLFFAFQSCRLQSYHIRIYPIFNPILFVTPPLVLVDPLDVHTPSYTGVAIKNLPPTEGVQSFSTYQQVSKNCRLCYQCSPRTSPHKTRGVRGTRMA